MQNLGFIFLYLFLGLGLHYYKPTSPQTESIQPNNPFEPQETKSKSQVKQTTSGKINPLWSFFAGLLVFIMVAVWQIVSAAKHASNVMDGLIFPIIYGIIIGCVVGIAFYVITRKRKSKLSGEKE